MLYTYHDFNVYLSKIFVSHIFLSKLGLKIWSSPKWLEFRRGVHYYMLITVLMFIFTNVVIHTILDKIFCCPSWHKSSICVHYLYYMLIIIEGNNFSKFLCPKYYGQISFDLVFFKLTELHRISKLNFSKNGEQQILGWNFSQKFMNGKYFEKLHIKTVISV